MLPFQPSFPQLPNQGETNMCTNQPHFPVQSSGNNPHFPVQSNGNNPQFPVQSNGNNPHFPVQSNGNNPHFPNNIVNPYQMQNMQMGLLPQGQFFQQNALPQPQGQFFANNCPQVPNMQCGQFSFHQFPQHMNQMNGVPQGKFPGFPQVNPFNMSAYMHPSMGCGPLGPQNGGFQMNQQPGMAMNLNQVAHNGQGQNMFMQSKMGGQSALHGPPITGQQLQRNTPLALNGGQAQMQQTQNNLQSNIPGKLEGNHANNGSNIPNINQWNPQGNNFTTNQQESARFQKSPMTNLKGNFRPFKGKGPNDKGARNPHMPKCTKQEISVENKSSRLPALNYTAAEVQKWREERRKKHPSSARSPASNYTVEEIQNWREERRKNHPSKSNTEKHSEDQTQSEDKARDAQKRRQQLKEILAKQAELGVEVAEIPKDYLLGSENQVTEIKQNGSTDERGRSRKRGGRRQHNSRFNRNKKQKFGDNDQSPCPAVIKEKPSLLQKLLSADIKRDKSHLLQAFRFMVLNNFFVDCPNKPLEFPSVTVDDKDSVIDVGKVAIPHQEIESISATQEVQGPNELDTLLEDVPNGNNSENEGSYEHVDGTGHIEDEDSEEGEITD